MKKGQAVIEVVSGVEGPSLYIGDETSGHRLAGPKPWGGGQTVHRFTVSVAELQTEAARFGAIPQCKPLSSEQRESVMRYYSHINYVTIGDIIDMVETAHGIKDTK